MRATTATLIFTLAVLAAGTAWPRAGEAEDNIYICAVREARECTPAAPCETVGLDEIFVAPLIVIDLEKKALVSAAMDDHGRQEPITGIQRSPDELIVYGQGNDEAWNAIISLKDGKLTGSVNSGEANHVLFGHCAPHAYPR